jgi:hypothetical protein
LRGSVCIKYNKHCAKYAAQAVSTDPAPRSFDANRSTTDLLLPTTHSAVESQKEMNSGESDPKPITTSAAGISPLMNVLQTVFGGGGIMLGASLVWSLLVPQHGDLFMRLLFSWLSSAWVVFPVGAGLAWLLPRYLKRRGLIASVGTGLLAGMAASLALTAFVWLWSNHSGLIGLIANRASQGYASYSLSVRGQVRDSAWRIFSVVAPVATVWVMGWALWINRTKRKQLSEAECEPAVTGVALRLSPRALQCFGLLLLGLGILATAALLITSWVGRGVQVPLLSFLLVGPAAAGLVVLGPWLGPLINPGGSAVMAWQLTAVALPVVILSLAPFFLTRQPVKLGRAVTAWCGLATALLFWMAAGVLSLGWSLG